MPSLLMKVLSAYSELVKSSAMTYKSGLTFLASSNMNWCYGGFYVSVRWLLVFFRCGVVRVTVFMW